MEEIVSDTELRLKAPGLPDPITEPASYKIQPKVDQTEVYEQVRPGTHGGARPSLGVAERRAHRP